MWITKEVLPQPSDCPAMELQIERDRDWTPEKWHLKVLFPSLVEILSNLGGMTSRSCPTGLWERDKLATTKMEDSSLRLRAWRTVHVGGGPSHPGALRGVQVPLWQLQVSWGGKGLLLVPKYSLSRSRQAATNQSKCAAIHPTWVVFQFLSISITRWKWVLWRVKDYNLVFVSLFSRTAKINGKQKRSILVDRKVCELHIKVMTTGL